MTSGKKLTSITIALVLAGCAAQDYRGEQPLPSQHESISEQSHLLHDSNPSSPEERARQAVELAVNQAQSAVLEGRYDDATRYYSRALQLDPFNAVANTGVNRINRLERRAALLDDARQAWAVNDTATAQMHLNSLLAEEPSNPGGLALREEIEASLVTIDEMPPELASRLNERLTLSFKEAPMQQVFEILSTTSNVNFLFDREVRGDQPVTIFLRNTTVAEAVSLILLTNQLEQLVVDENTILVYPNTTAKQREYQPLTIKAFQLVHGNAQSMANMLKSVLKARDIVPDERLNMLVMRDGADTIRLAERLISLHDIPAPEVMLEVTVLEVKRSHLRDLGIRWPEQLTLAPLASSGSTLTLDDLLNLRSDRIGAGISPMTLNASRQDGDANILANPRIRTRSQETANILIGERVPNITSTSTATGFVSESVQYVDVGLKLDVQPTVYPNDEVAIKISLEVSNIIRQVSTPTGSVVFQIGTRTASTMLRLRDGENQVLAGLITDEMRSSSNAVPGLRNLPLVGRLFSNERDENEKTEVVLSITPRLISNVRPPSIGSASFTSGTEATPRAPAPGRLAVEAPLLSSQENGLNHPPMDNDSISSAAEYQPPASIAPVQVAMPVARQSPQVIEMPPAPDSRVASSHLSLTGPARVEAGQIFRLAIETMMDQELSELPVQIDYDPSVLEAVAVTEGNLRGIDGHGDFTHRIDRELGQIYIRKSAAEGISVHESGQIAELAFRARKPSATTHVKILPVSVSTLGERSVRLEPPPSFRISVEP